MQDMRVPDMRKRLRDLGEPTNAAVKIQRDLPYAIYHMRQEVANGSISAMPQGGGIVFVGGQILASGIKTITAGD